MSAEPFRTAKVSTQVKDQEPDHAPQEYLGRARAETSENRCGRAIASDNEVSVLQSLLKFGWLTCRQVAAWVWPARTQQVQMARRTLNRLKVMDQVLVRMLPNGVPVYLLNNSGAARLREHGLAARSGKDLRMSRWVHRALCNWHTIALHDVYGDEVYSEHELYTGRAPIGQWCGKLADSLLVQGPCFKWIEVEHSRRRPSDMSRLMHLLVQGPLNPAYAHGLELVEIALVTTDVRLTNAIGARLEREIRTLELTENKRSEIQESTRVCVLSMSSGLLLQGYSSWCAPLLKFGSSG